MQNKPWYKVKFINQIKARRQVFNRYRVEGISLLAFFAIHSVKSHFKVIIFCYKFSYF